jgi:hypothetical protein
MPVSACSSQERRNRPPGPAGTGPGPPSPSGINCTPGHRGIVGRVTQTEPRRRLWVAYVPVGTAPRSAPGVGPPVICRRVLRGRDALSESSRFPPDGLCAARSPEPSGPLRRPAEVFRRSKDELALAVLIDMVEHVAVVPDLGDMRAELIAFRGPRRQGSPHDSDGGHRARRAAPGRRLRARHRPPLRPVY